MKRPDIDAIEMRAAAALDEVGGEWAVIDSEAGWEVVVPSEVTDSGHDLVADCFEQEVADFIAAALTDVPALVAYVRELERRLLVAQTCADTGVSDG